MLTTLTNSALLGTGKQPFRPDAATPAALHTAWATLAFAYTYGGQSPAQSADGWQAACCWKYKAKPRRASGNPAGRMQPADAI